MVPLDSHEHPKCHLGERHKVTLHPEGPTTGVATKIPRSQALGEAERRERCVWGGGVGAAAQNFEEMVHLGCDIGGWGAKEPQNLPNHRVVMHVLNVFPGETNNGICSPFFGRWFHSCLKRKGGVFCHKMVTPNMKLALVGCGPLPVMVANEGS